MHIEFDNSARLCRNVYYFEYKDVRYKLIQNNFRKWRDVLITIVENHNDQNSINNAYILASEFLSSLSWKNNSKISLHYSGGIGVPEKLPLRKAKSKIHNYRPQISFSDYSKGYYDICEIPNIETENQKIALTLFREALHSNNEYLTFLFFWQVLETGGNEPIGWVNKVYRKKKNFNLLLVSKDEVNHLPLNGKSLGNYLYDDVNFRNVKSLEIPDKVNHFFLKLNDMVLRKDIDDVYFIEILSSMHFLHKYSNLDSKEKIIQRLEELKPDRFNMISPYIEISWNFLKERAMINS